MNYKVDFFFHVKQVLSFPIEQDTLWWIKTVLFVQCG